MIKGGDESTINTHKGGSVYRCDEIADILRLEKELKVVKGKAMCLSVDLSPLNKMEIGNADISVRMEVEGKTDFEPYELLLPLFSVGSKDGAAVVEKLEELFEALELSSTNVTVFTADGGSENNGGDRVTGLGASGIMTELCPSAIWIWCGLHMGQICYKKSFGCLKAGYMKGLREVVAFMRKGQNGSKILAHCSRLAGEDNAEFQDSLVHAQLADEIDWKADERTKRGHRDWKFDHRVAKSATDIRFASAIPGNNLVLALGALLPTAIVLEWGGGRAGNFSCNSAHKAYSILTDPEWQFHSKVCKVTFREVVQVVFRELMENSSFNIPELAAGGMWQRWVARCDGLLTDDGEAIIESLFHGALSHAEEVEAKRGGETRSTLIWRATSHVKDLRDQLSKYFGDIYNRDEMLLPGMLCKEKKSARAAAKKLCQLWSEHIDVPRSTNSSEATCDNGNDSEATDDNDGDHDSGAAEPEPRVMHKAVARVMEKHYLEVRQFASGGLMGSALSNLLQEYNQRATSQRVESMFSVLTNASRSRTHIGL